MKPVKVGLLGLGTVGGGTVNVLRENGDAIAQRLGAPIQIVHASARDLSKARICDTTGIMLTTDPREVVDNPELDVVVELMGGDGIAREMVLRAIANGKHVVTANKMLLAKHGSEVFAAAREKGVMVAFEAAVAGGIPVIKAIREGLAANRIEWLVGIINGTGNFILTAMRDDDREFADVLAEAQRLGYAEADPTFDVEGIDAAHKLTILASIAFGIPPRLENVYTEGITRITRDDVKYADELGYRIKALGIARRTDKGVELRVHPTLIPEGRLIANVDGVNNAVLVKGNMVGPTMYYGAGAGAGPTASAVVADLIDVARGMNAPGDCRVPCLAFQPEAIAELPVLSMDEVETAFYLRMKAVDKPGVLSKISSALSDFQISIEAVIQKEPKHGERQVDLVILTNVVKEAIMNEAMRRLESSDTIAGPIAHIRVEHLD
ncbi:MAG: homoserine dehydrogenase [Gammaproteobacteria bacterium]|nr:homoserine dehydrogenase [Gammaproteobacteria bacterium]